MSSPVARAAGAPVPMIWLDATNPNSYSGTGTLWNDLSPNNADGTLTNVSGNVTFNSTTKAMEFPGGGNGSAYVSLNANMKPFTNGVSIEFEGEFGATRSNWERVFDFAAAPGSTDDAFWVGQLYGTNELTVEVWRSGTSAGYCHTATGGTGLGTSGDRSFAKWIITIGSDANQTCRIYKNGVELKTNLFKWSMGSPDTSVAGGNVGGTPYQLPDVVDRTSAFLGRSNFTADDDFEGSIRYIRIYNQVLTPEEAATNAIATVTFHANGGTGSMTSQSSGSATALAANSFQRDGYTFAGWNTAEDGKGVSYDDGSEYPFSSDTTLYAQWNVDPFATTTTTAVSTSTTASTTTVSTGDTSGIERSAVATDSGSDLPDSGQSIWMLSMLALVLVIVGLISVRRLVRETVN